MSLVDIFQAPQLGLRGPDGDMASVDIYGRREVHFMIHVYILENHVVGLFWRASEWLQITPRNISQTKTSITGYRF